MLDTLSKFLREFVVANPEFTSNAAKQSTQSETNTPFTKSARLLLTGFDDLKRNCLIKGSRPCILVPEATYSALDTTFSIADYTLVGFSPSLGHHMHEQLDVPDSNVLFMNGNRGWFVQPTNLLVEQRQITEFVDQVKLGESGSKRKLKGKASINKEEL